MIKRRFLPSMSALAAFDAVARTGSFTRAGKELALTQGAISRQIAAIEAQLGVTLVMRSARRVALTAPGVAYAARVRTALDGLAQAALEARGQAPDRALRLAILPTFGTRWLMPRIPGFVRAHPEITLHFATRIGAFDPSEGLDAAIQSGRGDWPGMRATLLLRETLVPVAAPAALADGSAAGLPPLGLLTRPELWAQWHHAQGHPGPPPVPVMRFEQLSTLAQAAVAGMGRALLPRVLITPELDAGSLRATGPDWDGGYGYYFLEPLDPSRETGSAPSVQAPARAVAAFRDWLLTEIARETLV